MEKNTLDMYMSMKMTEEFQEQDLYHLKNSFRHWMRSDTMDHLLLNPLYPSFEELAGNCAIWRNFADTGEELAIEGLKNLKAIADAM